MPRMPALPRLLQALLLAASLAFAAPATQPKLVIVLVVDGLPEEQLVRYREQFGKGGFRRLLDEGASFHNAHQAHGVTLTAVGHAAILTGAYPYQHGVIGNGWIDPVTRKSVYCTEDTAHTYLGEPTKASDGTSPLNLRVSTLGDELRYANGSLSKVVTVSGKDRGAILLAGKTGTAYMYMDDSGNFASSTYYMKAHPQWVQSYLAGKPQDRYYGKTWKPLLPAAAYARDAQDGREGFSATFASETGKTDKAYYNSLRTGPYLDELTLDFARAALDGEKLGANPAGVPDILGVSMSGHDYVNHTYGPESKMSHDHLQRVDRALADFLTYVDKKVGMDNVLVLLTADHGFPNTPEFAQANKLDAKRLDSKKMVDALEKFMADNFGVAKLIATSSMPNIYLDYALAEKSGLKRADVEDAAKRFLLGYEGIANVYTRTQMENGQLAAVRQDLLMRRAWHRELSGDITVVARPYWYYSSGSSGTSHGSSYRYDTNVPLVMMGKRWIKPGAYSQYAEVVDIAPTLAHLLQVRAPAAAEGRVLSEILR